MSAGKLSHPTFKIDFEFTDFPADANGCLYDPRMREILTRTGRRCDPGTEALAAVRILAKKMHTGMERFAEQYGLSEGRFQVLVRLNHVGAGRLAMGDLAEMLEVSPRTITGLIDNLERDGLVHRADDPNDRRAVNAEITDAGRERLKKIWRETAAIQGRLTRGLSETELVQLRHLCLRLIQTMSAEEGKDHGTN